MDLLSQSALWVALMSFALGFSVFAKNVRDFLFIHFALVSVCITAWALTFFLAQGWPELGFDRVHLFFNIALVPVLIRFIQVWVRSSDPWSRRWRWISGVLSGFLIILLFFHLENHPTVLFLMRFAPTLVVIEMIHRMRGDLVSQKSHWQGFLFTRRAWLYLGGLVVLLTASLDHAPWLGSVIPTLGNLALATYWFLLSQVVTQQRLLNVSALLSRFLVLLLMALTLTGIYSLLFAWIEKSSALFFLNSFIISFLLMMLLEPLRTMVGYFTRILLTKKHRSLESMVQQAERQLTGVLDFTGLFQTVLSFVQQVLQPQWVGFFVLTGDGTRFRRVRVLGHHAQTTKRLKEVLADHPLLVMFQRRFQKGKVPVLLSQMLENEMAHAASRSVRAQCLRLIQDLKALGGNLMIPLMDSGKILGFLILWSPQPPEPWGHHWGFLPMLYPYFQQAGQMMQSLSVYARQKEKDRLATLGEMAAGLAHEIRNPLGAIQGAVQYLDPHSDRPDRAFLQVILEEVDRLNQVVTQFLDYSKPTRRDDQSVELTEVVSKIVQLMRLQLPAGIQIDWTPSSSPAWVQISSEKVNQVLVNLIQNAQKALESKQQGRIDVRVQVEEQVVVMIVEDNGAGIKKEHLDKLFIPFFTTSPRGTGLGLSISQKIVEAHQGRIEVLSEEGKLSRFSVIFPRFQEKTC